MHSSLGKPAPSLDTQLVPRVPCKCETASKMAAQAQQFPGVQEGGTSGSRRCEQARKGVVFVAACDSNLCGQRTGVNGVHQSRHLIGIRRARRQTAKNDRVGYRRERLAHRGHPRVRIAHVVPLMPWRHETGEEA